MSKSDKLEPIGIDGIASRSSGVTVPSQSGTHALLISAHNRAAAEHQIRQYYQILSDPEVDLADLCAEAAGRNAQKYRLAVVGDSRDELIRHLESFFDGALKLAAAQAGTGPIAVFSGIGSQWNGMARALLEEEPAFRGTFEKWSTRIADSLGWSPADVCGSATTDLRIYEMEYALPCIVAMQVSLWDLLLSWGLKPSGVLGHSIGEISAAYVSGALTFEDATTLVCKRSQIEAAAKGTGGMAAIGADEATVSCLLASDDRVSIAGINGPRETVVTGDNDAIEELLQRLTQERIFARRVRVDVPCHSALLKQASEQLQVALAGITPRDCTIPFFSSVVGGQISGHKLNGAYWRNNMLDRFRFWDAYRGLVEAGHMAFVEISPHPILVGAMAQANSSLVKDSAAIATLRRGNGNRQELLRSAGALWAHGVDLHWNVLETGSRNRASMPECQCEDSLPGVDSLIHEDSTIDGQRADAIATPIIAAHSGLAQRIAEAPRAQRMILLLDFVREQVGRLLGANDINVDASFSDLGLTSIMLVQLAKLTENACGNNIDVADCFNYPSVRLFANLVFTKLENARGAEREDVRSVGKTAPERPIHLHGSDDPHQENNNLSVQRRDGRMAAGRDPVSIVGGACRLPGGVESLDDYWNFLKEGRSGIVEVPDDRWSADEFYNPDSDTIGGIYSRKGGFIHSQEQFDAAFFGISPSEAIRMDPLQRILLETAWHALENAGIDPHSLKGTDTGVFIGAMNTNDYLARKESGGQAKAWTTPYDSTSTANSALAGRVSYFLELTGPAMTLDTACSSSLVALHLAAKSIQREECSVAIVGGVSLMMAPWSSVAFSNSRMLSPDGECKTFSAGANGYVRGEGCGVVVLTSRSFALANNFRILANVIGTAVNQNGRSSGITAPSGLAQERVISAALRDAGREASEVGYIEAHGTGTPLGDPIEMGALNNIMSVHADRPRWFVGSVKTNIGHLEAAAGVAGLLKAALAIRHAKIPSHLNFTKLNPNINMERSQAQIPTSTMDWPDGYASRIAGVSSFGFTGSNAHAVLEGEPELAQNMHSSPPSTSSFILPISAKSPRSLRSLADSFITPIRDSGITLEDICWTAAVGRAHLSHRAALVAADRNDMALQLDALRTGKPVVGIVGPETPVQKPKIAFLFPGQGSQYPRMGRVLYEAEPVFREVLDTCFVAARDLGIQLEQVMWSADESELRQTKNVQPAIFAVQVALVSLLRSWGITPDVVLGHSLGEYAAACAAGSLSINDATRMVCRRALLMDQMAPGAMLAIEMPRAGLGAYDHLPQVSLAANNGPASIVISGAMDSISRWQNVLKQDGIRCKQLEVSHAFHSSMMDGMLDAFSTEIRANVTGKSQIPMVSTVLGSVLPSSDLLSAEYWRGNIRKPVLFHEAVTALQELKPDVLIEVGPKPVLLGMTAGNLKGTRVPTLRGGEDESKCLNKALAEVYVAGGSINWQGYHRGRPGSRVADIPLYPFEAQKYWVPFHSGSSDSEVESELSSALDNIVRLEESLSVRDVPLLDDHRVHGIPVLPAAVMLSAVLRGARQTPSSPVRIASCTIYAPFSVFPGDVQTMVVTVDHKSGKFEIQRKSSGALLVSGKIDRSHVCEGEPTSIHPVDTPDIQLSGDDLRAGWQRRGLAFGPSLASVQEVSIFGNLIIASVRMPSEQLHETDSARAPVLLDSLLQAAGAFFEQALERNLWLPKDFEGVSVHGAFPEECIARGAMLDMSGDTCSMQWMLCAADGTIVATIERCTFVRASTAVLSQGLLGANLASYQVAYSATAWKREPGNVTGDWVVAGAASELKASIVEHLGKDSQARVFEQLNAAIPAPKGVVFVCAASLEKDELTAVYNGLSDLHALSKQVIARGQPVPLYVVAENCEEFVIESLKAFCKSFALEEDDRWGGWLQLTDGLNTSEIIRNVNDLLNSAPGNWLTLTKDGLMEARLAEIDNLPAHSVAVSPARAYVISGGLGGLGISVATWLIENGAKHLILLGRKPVDGTSEEDLTKLRSQGATVDYYSCDITHDESVAAVITPIRGKIAGIVHCAGVLQDALLANQEWPEQVGIYDPKIRGALNLHLQTKAEDLDFFIVFSSVASDFGAIGQTAYGAANGFLDGLIAYRRRQGLPGLSISWPAWAGAGMAGRNKQAGQRYWESRGIAPIDHILGRHLFGILAKSACSHVIVAPGWHGAGGQKTSQGHSKGSHVIAKTIIESLAQTSESVRLDGLKRFLAEQIANVCGIDDYPFQLSGASFRQLGLDSFQLIELRTRLGNEGFTVPTELLLSNTSTREFAELLSSQLRSVAVHQDANAKADNPVKAPVSQEAPSISTVEKLMARGVQAVTSTYTSVFSLSDHTFREFGLDSFQLLELRGSLSREGINIPTELLLGNISTRAIAERVVADMANSGAIINELPTQEDKRPSVSSEQAPPKGDGDHVMDNEWAEVRELAQVVPLMSPFINGGWVQERYKTGPTLLDASSVMGKVTAETYLMPADGIFHLPLFSAFLWVDLLADSYVQMSGKFGDDARAHIRRFRLELGQRITRPTDITTKLEVRNCDSSCEGNFLVSADGNWKGTATFDIVKAQNATFHSPPTGVCRRLNEDDAQVSFDHYWNRFQQNDLTVDKLRFRRGKAQAVARKKNPYAPLSPYTLARWGSQLTLVYAHWSLGLKNKPRNESYVMYVDMSLGALGTDREEMALTFEPLKEIVDGNVCYLTGIFKAGEFATMEIKLTVPLRDVVSETETALLKN